MTKKEALWRDILVQRREKGIVRFTQKGLAEQFGCSLSTVSHALQQPRDSHAIQVTGRFFILENYKKLLILLASERKLAHAIFYQTGLAQTAHALEGLMPPQVMFALYSGYKFLYRQAPSEYDHVYVYASKGLLPEILNRLSLSSSGSKKKKSERPANLFVLETDPWLMRYSQPLVEQLYCDIWNAPEWYAKDFLRGLDEKLGELA